MKLLMQIEQLIYFYFKVRITDPGKHVTCSNNVVYSHHYNSNPTTPWFLSV